MNSLKHFKDFLKLCFQSQWNRTVYWKFIYFPWWFYTNITKQTLRQTSSCHMLWLVFRLLFLWCFIAMVSELTVLITWLQKGLICTSLKAILGGPQNKIYSVSAVQIRDRACEMLTFLCYPCAIHSCFLKRVNELQTVISCENPTLHSKCIYTYTISLVKTRNNKA